MTESTDNRKAAEQHVKDELANEAQANSKHGDDSPQANKAKDNRAKAENEVANSRKESPAA